MKLQILIPQYKENEEVIKPLLDSIAIQQNVDFNEIGVIICNDGSDVILNPDFLNSYPFKIDYLRNKHAGVSAARNACLDHATAEYVCFCDADDMFYNACGLWIVFREFEAGFDTLVSCFIEEMKLKDDKRDYINRDRDSTFCHGKFFRRQYLIDQNIRWDDSLTIHEDSYFNILTQNLSKNVKYCQSPFYLWKWRDDSVCRHDPKYILKTYNNMIDSNTALVKQFINRDMKDKAKYFIAFLVFDAYYLFNKPEWRDQENKEYRDKTEKRFQKYFLEFENYWNEVSDRDKIVISNQVRGRTINEGMQFEDLTLKDFINKIKTI